MGLAEREWLYQLLLSRPLSTSTKRPVCTKAHPTSWHHLNNSIYRKSKGDNNIFLVDATGWISYPDVMSDNLHPNVQGQIKIANNFISFLEKWGLSPWLRLESSIELSKLCNPSILNSSQCLILRSSTIPFIATSSCMRRRTRFPTHFPPIECQCA